MITILGPTASGKTAVAVRTAAALGAEIISADSRQIYRGMTVGTGKDLDEYTLDGGQIPYHLIDIRPAGYRYNVFEYQRDFLAAYRDITARGRKVILCGGSGMYVEAVVRGYELREVPPDEALRAELEQRSTDELIAHLASIKRLHNDTDLDTRKRIIRAIEIEHFYRDHPLPERQYPTIDNLYIGIDLPREVRRARITARLRARLAGGLIGEVETLLAGGLTPDDMYFYGLEYKFVTRYLTGQCTRDEMTRDLETAIHQFAKRQMTWFRGMERRGATIHWIDGTAPLDTQVAAVLDLHAGHPDGKC